MSDCKKFGICACCLIVLLRMSIGWQFLYEGLWKIDSLSTPKPFSAAGYLTNAQGPLRPFFRFLTGDPDDIEWLDADAMTSKWDDWQAKFVSHYQLTEKQAQSLDAMLNGEKAFYAELDQLPNGVEVPFPGSLGNVVSYNAERKLLVVDGKQHLVPRERDRLLSMVAVKEKPTDAEKEQNDLAKAFQKAVNNVYARSSRNARAGVPGMSFKERLIAMLKGDIERAGLIQAEHTGTIDYKRIGDIELLKEQLKRYETDLGNAELEFQFEHLKKQMSDIRELRGKLVEPVKALDNELKEEALTLLTPEQFARGPVSELGSPLKTRLAWINFNTRWSLTIIGACLVAGLFTRLAALGGAVWFAMFYLCMPPWPGVPQPPGPDHSFIVNKMLIECIAVLAIASLPSGRWFGVDALIHQLFCGKKAKVEANVEK